MKDLKLRSIVTENWGEKPTSFISNIDSTWNTDEGIISDISEYIKAIHDIKGSEAAQSIADTIELGIREGLGDLGML